MEKVTVAEFAELIKKTPARVRQMIQIGEIKSAVKMGRDWLIDKKESKKVLERPNQRKKSKK